MGLHINFPKHGKCNKTHHSWRTWEIGTHTFLMVWALFLIRFPCYGILHHVGNAWVSPSIYHILGKCSKTQRIGRAWEIDTNNFTKVWVPDFPPRVYFITWEMYGFSHQFPKGWENISKPPCERDLRYRYPYFSQNMATFLSLSFHPMAFDITSDVDGLSHQFFIAWYTWVFQSISCVRGKLSKTHLSYGNNLEH